MRLLQLSNIVCLLLTLVLASASHAAQPSSKVYGPVTPKETLSEIAQITRGEWRIPLKYVVEAMHELNPQAFSGNDINSLLIGSLLIVPDMEALSNEVPEQLANTPIPPRSFRGKQAATEKLAAVRNDAVPTELNSSFNEQLQQINSLLTNNQQNIDTLKKLINQINTFQQRNDDLQKQLKDLSRKQQIDARQVQALQAKIESMAASDNSPTMETTNAFNLPISMNSPDLYLMLLLIPTLLALIAILMARRSPAPVTSAPLQPLPEPVFRQPEIRASSQPATKIKAPTDSEKFADDITDEDMAVENTPQVNKALSSKAADDDTPVSTPIVNKVFNDDTTSEEPAIEDTPVIPPVVNKVFSDDTTAEEPVINQAETSTPQEDQEDEPSVVQQNLGGAFSEEMVLDDVDKAILETTIAEDIQTPATMPEIEPIDEADVSEELQIMDDSSVTTIPEETQTSDNKERDIQELKTAEDEIEAKLSFALLHLDMENIEQASITLEEIDLVKYPQFIKRVDEIWQFISQAKEAEKTKNETNTTESSPAPQPQQSAAMEKVLREQIKLANTYFNNGQLEQCKIYIAKILRRGTEKYRKRALTLLKQIENTTADSDIVETGLEEIDAEKTVFLTPNATAVPAAPKEEVSTYHDLIPRDISNRFDAYSDNEEGTKLALAYLFLDLNEVDTAKQLLEEVLEEGDANLTSEAECLLEKLRA